MLQGFSGEPVMVVRRTYSEQYDDYGLQKQGLSYVELEAVLGFRTTSSSRDVVEQVQESEVRLFFPAGTIIMPDDLFVVRGTLWEKDGETIEPKAGPFKTPLIFALPIVVNIKQSAGNVDPSMLPLSEEEDEEDVEVI